jgi:hypothetical protein
MRSRYKNAVAKWGLALGLAFLAQAPASPAIAQAMPPSTSPWRIGASAGGWVPFAALIRAADAFDTRLEPGPAFALEPRYLVSDALSIYVNGTAAFSTIRLGSSIRPEIKGPSDLVVLAAGTAGLMLAGDGWLGENLQPTLRLGGGIKWYRFDMLESEGQVRPTADLGVGLRGVGSGPIEVTAEVRYLPSSFDQARLPTRGIAAQDQRQTDVVFSIGIAIRLAS